MSFYNAGMTGKWLRHDAMPGRGEVVRNGIILTATVDHDTPEDREIRIRALESKFAAREKLFEDGPMPDLQVKGTNLRRNPSCVI